jgi:hypothetical protein
MIALCDAVGRNARVSSSPRALLDALVVRLAMAEKFADATALLAGGAAGGGGSHDASPPRPGGPAGASPGKAGGMLSPGRERAAAGEGSPEQSRQQGATVTRAAATEGGPRRETEVAMFAAGVIDAVPPAGAGADAPAVVESATSAPGEKAGGEEAEFAAQPLGVDVGAAAFWDGVRVAAQARPALVPVLGRVEVKSLAPGLVTLACSSMMAGAVRTRVKAIEEWCAQVAGDAMSVALEVVEEQPAAAGEDDGPGPADGADERQERAAPPAAAGAEVAQAAQAAAPPSVDAEAVASDPLVQEAMSLFKARIVNVVPRV